MSFVVIWSGEHHAYWRPGGEGYTTQFSAAGLYTMEDAEQWTSGCGPEKKIDIRSFEVECALHSNATVIAHLRSEGIRDPDLWQVQVDGHDEREGAFCTEREAQAEVVRVCTELAVDAERERIPEVRVLPVWIGNPTREDKDWTELRRLVRAGYSEEAAQLAKRMAMVEQTRLPPEAPWGDDPIEPLRAPTDE